MFSRSSHRMIYILFALSFFGQVGCAKMAHMQELLTLKALSDNQAQQAKYVEREDKKFTELLEAVKNNQLHQYPNQKSVLKAFGEPILRRKKADNTEQWLYRYSARLSNSEKVYIYFDREGMLTRFEHILLVPVKNNPNT